MNNWKQSFSLAKFELRESIFSPLTLLFNLIILTFGLIMLSSDFDTKFGSIFYDLFFLVIFLFTAGWIQPKVFRVQRTDDNLWIAPSVLMLMRLPIPANIIYKSRLIIYFSYSFPFHLLFLTGLYGLSANIRELITLDTYIVFSIIWLTFSIYIGSIVPVSEVGGRISKRKLIISSISIYGGLIVAFTSFYFFSDYGLVQWTIILAQNKPTLSILISILLAIIGFNYWHYYALKQMKKVNY